MKTIKEILIENRESAISSLKWETRCYKREDLKKRMQELLELCEKKYSPKTLNETKYPKKYIREAARIIGKRIELDKREKVEKRNIELFGTAKPKLADIMSAINEKYIEQGKKWNPIDSVWE